MKEKITVIHHSADYDGLFCREIARKFHPEAELIGWDFGNAPLKIPTEGIIYVMDLPVDRVFGFDFVLEMSNYKSTPGVADLMKRLVWIDHHRSSIATHPESIPGYRIDGVAACRLAWQFFSAQAASNPSEPWTVPVKDDYGVVKPDGFRSTYNVSEPLAVRLAGEYDIWDHVHSNNADVAFQFGLDCKSEINWDALLRTSPSHPQLGHSPHDGYAMCIVDDGKKAMACYAKRDGDVMRERSFIVTFDGLNFLALNTPRCNSQTFAVRDVPETGHDALMAFYFTGKDWSVSMYHAAHRKDLDLSVIAVRLGKESGLGGGGHAGACGFRAYNLPFLKND